MVQTALFGDGALVERNEVSRRAFLRFQFDCSFGGSALVLKFQLPSNIAPISTTIYPRGPLVLTVSD